ncbi:PREDICTED: auxin-induced protein 10A5-like [Prunus mume]|uniref:Auxin-induced protein 10A5-like n=1 Tax=Prunus mume TaxID=102107 RepID=A0ABM0NKW3_PRUMU|nr:PREDICTED: auxin-induced protein 10A5-like [Prunus mume]
MAKSRTSSACKKKNSIVKLKVVVEKLQRSLSLGRSKPSNYSDDSTRVPEDVKEGHFAVIAVDGDEPKRFVVALSYLTHPAFLKLLEQAAEEYGFDHEGALTIPCQPRELEKILDDDRQWQKEERGSSSDGNWGSCKAMVQSY